MTPIIKLRGAALLKVISIIMIIFGAISLVSGLSSIGSGPMMVRMFGLDELGIQYFKIIGTISIVTGIAEIVFGILGIRFRNRPDKVMLLLIVGIVQMVIAAFSALYHFTLAPIGDRVTEQIMQATMEMYGVTANNAIPNATMLQNNIILNSIGFVIPALFIIGVLLNRLPPKVKLPEYDIIPPLGETPNVQQEPEEKTETQEPVQSDSPEEENKITEEEENKSQAEKGN
jgi:hypothetical protein